MVQRGTEVQLCRAWHDDVGTIELDEEGVNDFCSSLIIRSHTAVKPLLIVVSSPPSLSELITMTIIRLCSTIITLTGYPATELPFIVNSLLYSATNYLGIYKYVPQKWNILSNRDNFMSNRRHSRSVTGLIALYVRWQRCRSNEVIRKPLDDRSIDNYYASINSVAISSQDSTTIGFLRSW